jgi:hypothetical protein
MISVEINKNGILRLVAHDKMDSIALLWWLNCPDNRKIEERMIVDYNTDQERTNLKQDI